MGEQKRREEAEKKKKEMGITTLHVGVTGDVKDNVLGNVGVRCDQTGNWLAVATLLLRGLEMAMQEHTKQIFEASQKRIVKPTDGDIALARGGKLPGGL